MVQGIFFSLSQVSFPSVIRTVVVNVATLTKFTLFLTLSFMTAAPSQRIAREFQNTQRICNTFRTNAGHNKEVQRMLQLLSLQLQNRKTRISAAGFFDVDYTMILNMLVSTVSYVIVFLQINAKLSREIFILDYFRFYCLIRSIDSRLGGKQHPGYLSESGRRVKGWVSKEGAVTGLDHCLATPVQDRVIR
ncbi:hypothetical protein TcasGA2_TC034666 [Tribolium castaneum]|uniref:Gustatory receptor n=1 Tax=Tribolium castaneum TaxID=7070 RepID=A0A139WJ93_TRICA|nr:hypothetical protein TcasGA2_TC034666 [Tribolium castaneum]